MAKRVLVALGGNAIKQPDEKGTFEEQMKNVEIASKQIAQLVRHGFQLVITHGNGPQVGNLAIQQEAATDQVPPQPLVVLGAMTQGQIGYMMQQHLNNILDVDGKQVATIVTQVLVSPEDPDFKDPTKPVGPFYTEEMAKRLSAERGYVVKKVRPTGDKTWRRVVPSPFPLGIVEAKAIRIMVEAGMVVIASGGGGIPVFRNKQGDLEGVDAVIDKDRAGAKLAEEVGSDILLILTDVEYAMMDYGKPSQAPIHKMTVPEAKKRLQEGQFGAGSMGPKVEAALGFVDRGGERAIITSLEKAVDALNGKTGTHIVPA
ncbi:MAG: carbamate kinase [Candidatus Bathyarchaeia archaeon]|jgi:carbamate kinase